MFRRKQMEGLYAKKILSDLLSPPKPSTELLRARIQTLTHKCKVQVVSQNGKGLSSQGTTLAQIQQNQNLPEGMWGILVHSSRQRSSLVSVLSLSRCFHKTEPAFSERQKENVRF